jgi:hypothetical protein
MRVGILEREQPIPVRFKALWRGFKRDFQGFGLAGVVLFKRVRAVSFKLTLYRGRELWRGQRSRRL